MLNEDVLNELIGMQPGSPVLSVYLDVSPQTGAADTTRLRVRQLIKDYAAQVPGDVEQILHYIDHEFEGTSRSLAVFSCMAANIFRTFSFAVPIRSRARLLESPYVKPLANLLDNYGHIGIVLVDQQDARLLHFHLGQLAAQVEITGEEVRQTKHGSGSSSPGRRTSSGDPARYADERIERNLRQAADAANHFFQQHGVRRILVAASEPITQPFIEHLPKRWQTLVMGTFSIGISAQTSLIFERALTILQAAEQARDERMLKEVIDAAAKGGEGVIGLEATLADVHAGRVKTLYIRDGYRAPGHRCQNCGYLSLRMPGSCPYCGGSSEYIEDAVEYAVQRVIASGGEVEVVAAHPLTEQMGNIAAQLRY